MPTLFRGRCRARSLAVLAAVATTALLGPATQGASAQTLAPATSAGDKVGLSTHLFWLGESDITANLRASVAVASAGSARTSCGTRSSRPRATSAGAAPTP